jgi:hypothetical protein
LLESNISTVYTYNSLGYSLTWPKKLPSGDLSYGSHGPFIDDKNDDYTYQKL